ncbi:glycoside hydrolase family 3 N-terminal domain-containing protein [Cytophagaceae bacterium ABcell3]|nr:glycoside hydrolase family 3 N-terminal domain-containing protein [Cytophagaceae bacterium ABcell3]
MKIKHMILPKSFIKVLFLTVLVLSFRSVSAQTIRSTITGEVDPEGKYLFYIHDFSAQSNGMVDIDLYDEILRKICNSGFHVISENRKFKYESDRYAKNVGEQIKVLLKEGVPAENITVTGVGKGVEVAMDVAHLLRKDVINYTLVSFGDNWANIISEDTKRLSGNVLWVNAAPKSNAIDSLGFSHTNKNLQAFEILSVPSVQKLSELYKNTESWIVPVVNWANDRMVYLGSLSDKFFSINPFIDEQVEKIFSSLSDTQRVGQMIITSAGELGKPDHVVKDLVEKQLVGGVTFMKNSKLKHVRLAKELNQITESSGGVPLMLSMDAEPELLSMRVTGIAKLPSAFSFRTDSVCLNVVDLINRELKEIGVHQNFAPVADLSANNKVIKTRSFCSDADLVCSLSETFIGRTQSDGILATVKHFPGHGLVEGDTHEQSVFIDGDLQELDVFRNLIQGDVLSVMVGHLTIRNNEQYDTEGLPASCSPKIVNGLLKDELGYKGLVVTDALNIMKAVNTIENAPLLASKAGNDLLLMPISEVKTIKSILNEMEKDMEYKDQVYESVKKVLRMKVALGLM